MKEDGTEDDTFESVYDGDGREEMAKNDEISPEEEAFMKGYDEADEEEKESDADEELDEAFDEDDEEDKK